MFLLFNRSRHAIVTGTGVINIIYYPRRDKTGLPTRSDTSRPVQSHEKARSLKFWIYEEEEGMVL